MGTKFKVGQVVWDVPIRYWEETQPTRCVVTEVWDSHSLMVHHDGYGHEVAVNKADVFDTVEEAVAEAERRALAKKTKQDADFEGWFEKHLASLLASEVPNG